VNPRQFYDLGYRFFRMPWEIGPRQELVELVTAGRLLPGRAVDLLFDIEYLAGTREPNRFRPIPGFAAYLLTRRGTP
jgi:hypothetical protein